MDKPSKYKAKNKKPLTKPRSTRKRISSEGPACSMFLNNLTKKLAHKRKQEVEEEEAEPKNVVQSIIDGITGALPIIFSKKPMASNESAVELETLQNFAPELMPNDTVVIRQSVSTAEPEPESVPELRIPGKKGGKHPKMPVVSSEVLKLRSSVAREDVAVNTGSDHDVATEIARHVGTLKKISLIAEEFNQKTAKNLKEIVDSVQEDLIRKLEEIQTEQKNNAPKVEEPMQVEQEVIIGRAETSK